MLGIMFYVHCFGPYKEFLYFLYFKYEIRLTFRGIYMSHLFFLMKILKFFLLNCSYFPARLLLQCIKIAPVKTVYHTVKIVLFFI